MPKTPKNKETEREPLISESVWIEGRNYKKSLACIEVYCPLLKEESMHRLDLAVGEVLRTLASEIGKELSETCFRSDTPE
ncbi:MAG: hypothetical protein LBJ20_03645 [Candidatus Methanoplasma sp.]|nr:hypothetical protein [Candidatus Methanoplasma sp.]